MEFILKRMAWFSDPAKVFLTHGAPIVALSCAYNRWVGVLYFIALMALELKFWDWIPQHHLSEAELTDDFRDNVKKAGYSGKIYVYPSSEINAYADASGEGRIAISSAALNSEKLPPNFHLAMMAHEIGHLIHGHGRSRYLLNVIYKAAIGLISLYIAHPVSGYVSPKYGCVGFALFVVGFLISLVPQNNPKIIKIVKYSMYVYSATISYWAISLVFDYDWFYQVAIALAYTSADRALSHMYEIVADEYGASIVGKKVYLAFLPVLLTKEMNAYEDSDTHPSMEKRKQVVQALPD